MGVVPCTAGIPEGGTANQVLTKQSDQDRDAAWADIPPAGGAGGATYVPVTQYINSGNANAGVPVIYFSAAGSVGGFILCPDETFTAGANSSVEFFLYRNGTKVGDARVAGIDVNTTTSDIVVGSAFTIPLNDSHPSVSGGRVNALSGDLLFCTCSGLGVLVAILP